MGPTAVPLRALKEKLRCMSAEFIRKRNYKRRVLPTST
ncbi:unnamed protein product [Acanthoscelides obtectus]|uniref:Uncharacterized protein n=1 Tax=Acanthoscelides obtectus TaxID=200917 RepID=A0A9P0Q7A5_ACAOB|nr:unnamed protein product [Acanthoscelides obtectus]CAK1683921.1 hypothetical protein AOBTE_LOCUS34524 [Acanthoscelides obtectus]